MMPDTNVRAILLDIEGTTTPIEFVYKVLFPFARRHVREFIKQHNQSEDLRAIISGLRVEHSAENLGRLESGSQPPAWEENSADSQLDSVTQYVYWLMDQDRKSTALKALQGKIWETGYLSGRLLGQVYPDVPPAFARWGKQEKKIYIYSSGSILAQKLLFAHTNYGDLSGYINDYFDTTTGAKRAETSYQSIAEKTALPATEVLFLSDVTAELDAARGAGIATALCVRPGNPEPKTDSHPIVHTFENIFP
jgi:enolase-phosphatase E1